mgnify:CR=1 FL=1
MKKVTFGGKRPSNAGTPEASIDNWVLTQSPERPREQMKRFTIDVPVSLHKRVKSQCAMQNLVMADVIRELLEQRFPAPVEQAAPSEEGSVANTTNRKYDSGTAGNHDAVESRG